MDLCEINAGTILPLFDNWSSGLSYTVAITEKCNCSCQHCLSIPGSKDIHQTLFEKICSSLSEFNANNILLTGGEPLLHANFTGLVSTLENYSIAPKIVTNGILLSYNIASRIKPLTDRISISLDGDRSAHTAIRRNTRAFQGVVSAVKICQDLGIAISIITSLFKDNVDQIDWVVDFCLNHSIKNLRIQPVFAVGRGRELKNCGRLLQQDDLLLLYNKLIHLSAKHIGMLEIKTKGRLRSEIECHGCLFGLHFGIQCHRGNAPWPMNIIIDTDGNMFPHSQFVRNEFIIGNIQFGLKKTLTTYFGSSSHIRFLHCLREGYKEKVQFCSDLFVDQDSILMDILG